MVASKKTRKRPLAPSKPGRSTERRPGSSAPVAKIDEAPSRAAKGDNETVSWWEDFYRVVRLIPAGRVATYGFIAALGGHPRSARPVGYAMAALKDTGKNSDVPWQRVLGAAPRQRAKVSIKDPIGGAIQRGLLEAEGVVFDDLDRVSLAEFGWAGPAVKKSRRLRG